MSWAEKESNYVSFEKPLGQPSWQPVSSPTHTWLISTHFHLATENAPHSTAPASFWCNYTQPPPHIHLLRLRSTQALISARFRIHFLKSLVHFNWNKLTVYVFRTTSKNDIPVWQKEISRPYALNVTLQNYKHAKSKSTLKLIRIQLQATSWALLWWWSWNTQTWTILVTNRLCRRTQNIN